MDLVEKYADDTVVVYGTPPPEGRDLDLLVRDGTAAALIAALSGWGYEQHGRTWVRFAGGEVQVVDLTAAASWGLPPAAEAEVFAAARPLPGRTLLAAPSPAHRLLIEARRMARSGSLTDKSRGRSERALEEDPEAAAAARRMAARWGCEEALECLRDVLAGRQVPAGRLRQARRETERARGRRPASAALFRSLVPARRRGRILALSGLDGSGKSGQATRLAAGLDKLGFDTVVVWTRLGSGVRLTRIGEPVKRIVGAVLTRKPPASTTSRYAPEFQAPDPIRSSRENNCLVSFAWAVFVTLDHVAEQRRAVRSALRAGQVVVCDRWALDSIAHLRYRYGHSTPLALHEWLLRTLSPRADAAFLLAVSGETAHARKPDQYAPEQLQRQAELYAQAAHRLDVHVLDGTLPVVDLADRIGSLAWRVVRAPRWRPWIRPPRSPRTRSSRAAKL